MKLRIRGMGIPLTLHVPLWVLRLVKDEEYQEIIDAIYAARKELKKYKGLKILEVHDKDGADFSITL